MGQVGIMGSGLVLRGQDKHHISSMVSHQGEGVAVGKLKEVLLDGTRDVFCPHVRHCIPLALRFVALSIDGHMAENYRCQ